MKKIVMLLFIIMLGKTISFSQTILNDTTVYITAKQLKTTNLIFLEHQKLLAEDSLLVQELQYQKQQNKLLIEADSIRQQHYKVAQDNCNLEKEKLQKTLNVWKIGGISLSTALLILLLIK